MLNTVFFVCSTAWEKWKYWPRIRGKQEQNCESSYTHMSSSCWEKATGLNTLFWEVWDFYLVLKYVMIREENGIQPLFFITCIKIPSECRSMGKHWLPLCCQAQCPTSTHKTCTHTIEVPASPRAKHHHLGSVFREPVNASHPSSPMICESNTESQTRTPAHQNKPRSSTLWGATTVQLKKPLFSQQCPIKLSFGLACVYLGVRAYQFADFGNSLTLLISAARQLQAKYLIKSNHMGNRLIK